MKRLLQKLKKNVFSNYKKISRVSRIYEKISRKMRKIKAVPNVEFSAEM